MQEEQVAFGHLVPYQVPTEVSETLSIDFNVQLLVLAAVGPHLLFSQRNPRLA